MVDVVVQAVVFIQQAIDWLLIALVIGTVVLLLLRAVLLRVNPFGWVAYYVRRATDPLVWPIAQHLPDNAAAAPLILLIATLIGAFFFKWVTNDVLTALVGLLTGVGVWQLVADHRVVALWGRCGFVGLNHCAHRVFVVALCARGQVYVDAVQLDRAGDGPFSATRPALGHVRLVAHLAHLAPAICTKRDSKRIRVVPIASEETREHLTAGHSHKGFQEVAARV